MLEQVTQISTYAGMLFGLVSTVFIAGLLDRVRGDKFGYSKAVEQIVYGWFVADSICHGFDEWTIPFVAAFVTGAAIGWGKPYGAFIRGEPMETGVKLHWWQVGSLKTNVRLAIIARGGLWGAPILLLGNLGHLPEISIVGVAYIIAFPLALFTARDWELSESVRGWIAMALIQVVLRLS
jgi:hypothetical protein